MKISVVIIAKNEEDCIKKCIESALQITDNVIVVDTGSTDSTMQIVASSKARLIQSEWKGYGETRNYGATFAVHDFIFSLDADEIITNELANEILKISYTENNCVYKIKRNSFYLDKKIRFGSWGNDFVIRIYNRKITAWNTSLVHEEIIVNDKTKIIKLKNIIEHYTVKNTFLFTQKILQYSQKWAIQHASRKSNFKQYISPAFTFFQEYILKFGFLDGKEGYKIAKLNAFYTYMKYALLSEMNSFHRKE